MIGAVFLAPPGVSTTCMKTCSQVWYMIGAAFLAVLQ